MAPGILLFILKLTIRHYTGPNISGFMSASDKPQAEKTSSLIGRVLHGQRFQYGFCSDRLSLPKISIVLSMVEGGPMPRKRSCIAVSRGRAVHAARRTLMCFPKGRHDAKVGVMFHCLTISAAGFELRNRSAPANQQCLEDCSASRDVDT